MSRNNQISGFEMLESRTMMSAAPMPHVEAAVRTPVVHAPLRHVVKTVANPAVTQKNISYKDFSSDPLFASTGPTMSDINQGTLGDCYLLSTLSSVVNTDPGLIKKDIVSDGAGVYTVTFGAGKGTQITVDSKLPVWSDGQLAYAQLGNQNSTWVAIYEKAFAVYQNPKADRYATINGGWMSEAFNALGLKNQTIESAPSATNLLATLQSDLQAGDFATFGTIGMLPSSSPLVAGHAYEVNSVQDNSSGTPQTVTLRNPWGNGAADDGMITITAKQAYSAFAGIVIANV